MARRFTQSQFIQKAETVWGVERWNYDKSVFRGTKKDVQIGCPEHGYFEQKAGGHLEGHVGCFCCTNRPVQCSPRLKTTHQFIGEAQAIWGEARWDYSKIVYINSKQRVVIGCPHPDHGEFRQLPTQHLKGALGCKSCIAVQRRLTRFRMIAEEGRGIDITHPEIAARYSSKNDIPASHVSYGSALTYWWICSIADHPDYLASPQDQTKRVTECPICRYADAVDDLTGRTFGSLTVHRRAKKHEYEQKTSSSMWVCDCACGNEHIVPSQSLKKGLVKRCPKCNNRNRRYIFGEIPLNYWTVLTTNAKLRDLELVITPEYAWNLFVEQDRKCALTKVTIGFRDIPPKKPRRPWRNTASLDRIDNSKGYFPGNVQWVHKDINRIKRDFNEAVLFDWIKKMMTGDKIRS